MVEQKIFAEVIFNMWYLYIAFIFFLFVLYDMFFTKKEVEQNSTLKTAIENQNLKEEKNIIENFLLDIFVAILIGLIWFIFIPFILIAIIQYFDNKKLNRSLI